MERSRNSQQVSEDPTLTESLKCVWMSARVVDYKLCERQYDCEHCPFDKALREGAVDLVRRPASTRHVLAPDLFVGASSQESSTNWVEVRGYELAGPLFYHPGHVWAGIEENGRVRIGLDDFGQKLVGRVYSVNLPEPGTQVYCGGSSWSVTHRIGETRLASPVTGRVEKTNEKLASNPSLINRDTYGQGWAMVIQPDELVENLADLYFGDQAEQWYDLEIARLQRGLRILIQSMHPEVGMTLQDGGAPIRDLGRLIQATQLQHIIDTFLPAPLGREREAHEDRPMDEEYEER